LRHQKHYFKMETKTESDMVIIEGPVDSDTLRTYTFDDNLTAFRRPDEQFQALVEIAELPEGRIIVSHINKHIVGYIIFLHPDPLERWSDGNHSFIMELGAVEVALPCRGLGLAGKMLELSTYDDFIENYIIITTEYYWHWDLKNSGLDVYEYKNLMIRLMQRAGYEVFQTNDPEITGHPANTLMARIGKNINDRQMQQFDEIRFKNRFLI